MRFCFIICKAEAHLKVLIYARDSTESQLPDKKTYTNAPLRAVATGFKNTLDGETGRFLNSKKLLSLH